MGELVGREGGSLSVAGLGYEILSNKVQQLNKHGDSPKELFAWFLTLFST